MRSALEIGAFGLGRFGDRRLQKGGPCCTPRWSGGRVRASGVLAAPGPARCSSPASCAIGR
jgi:hypothetical protein